MTSNARHFTALAVLLVFLCSSALAYALKVPPPPDYSGRGDPHTTGGERYGEHEGFDGYPVDPGKPGDLYHDTTTEYRAYSPSWTGATWGFGVMGGVGRLYGKGFDDVETGAVFGGFVSMSTLLHIVNGTLSVTRGGFNVSIDDNPADVTRWDMHASVAIHPGFFFNLSGGRMSQTIGQFHLLAGGNLTVQSTKGDTIDSRFVRPGYHLGVGIDTPIDSPHDGSAFWIGVQYRWTNTAGGLHDDHFRYKWTREHQIFLRLSFRVNGNLVNRHVPGPSSR